MPTSKDNNTTIHNLGKITARLMALKLIYCHDFDEQAYLASGEVFKRLKINEIYADMLEQDEIIVEPDQDFLAILYTTTTDNLDPIDEIISRNLKPGWTIEKLDPVIKNILRLAISELLFFGDIPRNVIIDQYVSLTGDFYAKKEVGFVNALIDKFAQQTRSTRPD